MQTLYWLAIRSAEAKALLGQPHGVDMTKLNIGREMKIGEQAFCLRREWSSDCPPLVGFYEKPQAIRALKEQGLTWLGLDDMDLREKTCLAKMTFFTERTFLTERIPPMAGPSIRKVTEWMRASNQAAEEEEIHIHIYI